VEGRGGRAPERRNWGVTLKRSKRGMGRRGKGDRWGKYRRFLTKKSSMAPLGRGENGSGRDSHNICKRSRGIRIWEIHRKKNQACKNRLENEGARNRLIFKVKGCRREKRRYQGSDTDHKEKRANVKGGRQSLNELWCR